MIVLKRNPCHPLNQSDAKTKTTRDLVTRVFPRLAQGACFEFSSVHCIVDIYYCYLFFYFNSLRNVIVGDH